MTYSNFEFTDPGTVLPRKAAVEALVNAPNLTPYLVPIEQAVPGDLVAMVGGHYCNAWEYTLETHLEVFYVQGEYGLEVRWYDELPEPARDSAARLIAERLFLAPKPHGTFLSQCVVECSELYQVQSVHFADAVLYVNKRWMEDALWDEELGEVHPILFEMEQAPDSATAQERADMARGYLALFRHMLPDHLQNEADWEGVMIDPDDFLAETPTR